jgi:glycerol-3-phosphate O-acyltransferase
MEDKLKSDIPKKVQERMERFLQDYLEAGGAKKWCDEYLKLVEEQCRKPFTFEPYHQCIRSPYDYYRFGNEFLRPFVDKTASRIEGKKYIEEIVSHLRKSHNVILFANHQIEADPQAISLLLDDEFPHLAEEMIFVAGERVITDPIAIPFSMGRNLLCIYSKRYIDHPPEKKWEKQHHNKKTMELMSQLLKRGGKCIYIAPSGGRDRISPEGKVEVAPFDPQSIEMCYLMAQKSGHPTHFYPMALATYHLLPPPQTIQIELGEERKARRGPIHLCMGPSIDMERYPGYDLINKHERRQKRADYIWRQVLADYEKIAGT